jgi:hypothetical protein
LQNFTSQQIARASNRSKPKAVKRFETIKAVGCNLTSETASLATFAGPKTGEGWPVDVGATSFTITNLVI